MSGRLSNGWGECVWCGEMLKPEDEEKYADRCPFCCHLRDLFSLIMNRIGYCEKKLKQKDLTEKAKKYWEKKLTNYNVTHEKTRDLLKLKKSIWGEGW